MHGCCCVVTVAATLGTVLLVSAAVPEVAEVLHVLMVSCVAGTYLDEEDVVSVSSKKQDDGRTVSGGLLWYAWQQLTDYYYY